jgi:hypothetical protein
MQGNSFKALKILHTALLTGLALFIIVAYVLIRQKLIVPEKDVTLETIFQVLAAAISIGSLLAGYNLFKKQLVAARGAERGEVRFEMYRAACIMWWAFLEAPGLFAAVSYLKTGNVVFIILALFHLGMLIVFMPRKDNIVLLLNLTSDDVQKLEGVKVQ